MLGEEEENINLIKIFSVMNISFFSMQHDSCLLPINLPKDITFKFTCEIAFPYRSSLNLERCIALLKCSLALKQFLRFKSVSLIS